MSVHEIIADSTAKGPYSTAIRAGGFVFLSGQGGVNPVTGEPVSGGFEVEARQTIQNIVDLLGEAGLGLDNLVQLTCYLTDLADWPLLNEICVDAMGPTCRPTRTAVGVATLPFGLSLEMTAVAYDG